MGMFAKYCNQPDPGQRYGAGARCATFSSPVLENGPKPKDARGTIGYADPSSSLVYDRLRLLVTKSETLVVNYGL
jgi:hypothetical protein